MVAACLRERQNLGESYVTGHGIAVAVDTRWFTHPAFDLRIEGASVDPRFVSYFVALVPRAALHDIRRFDVELPPVGSAEARRILRWSGMGGGAFAS